MHISGPRAGIIYRITVGAQAEVNPCICSPQLFWLIQAVNFLCFSTVWYVRWGLCTKSDHYVSHVDHACGGCAVALLQSRLRGGPAIHLSLRCGPATEQADKSSWTLDATRCFRDSTEQLEEHVQDMHECRRTFLFAPYALVRSNSMWKQRGWHQPQHSSPNVWCRLHCETATEHLATLLSDSISPIRQTAT